MTRPDTAQEAIALLRSRGLTDQAIGRAVGRNSSLIFQIGRGAKPGRNLLAPLADLLAGRPVTEPERRRQRVRTPTPSAAGWRTKRYGKQAIANTAGDSLEKELRAAAAKGWMVGITVHTKKGKSQASVHYSSEESSPLSSNRPATEVLADFLAWQRHNRGGTVMEWIIQAVPPEAGVVTRVEFRSWAPE